MINQDNTVSFAKLKLQIEGVSWGGTLAGCAVTVHQHLDGSLSIRYETHFPAAPGAAIR
jgi:hypothetical protein